MTTQTNREGNAIAPRHNFTETQRKKLQMAISIAGITVVAAVTGVSRKRIAKIAKGSDATLIECAQLNIVTGDAETPLQKDKNLPCPECGSYIIAHCLTAKKVCIDCWQDEKRKAR